MIVKKILYLCRIKKYQAKDANKIPIPLDLLKERAIESSSTKGVKNNAIKILNNPTGAASTLIKKRILHTRYGIMNSVPYVIRPSPFSKLYSVLYLKVILDKTYTK